MRTGRADEEVIAVRGRVLARLGADDAARARLVVDDEGLAQPFLQLGPDKTACLVRAIARRAGNDDFYRPCRPSLRCTLSMNPHGDERQGQ